MDRARERELQPCGQHDAEHGQGKWQGEDQCSENARSFPPHPRVVGLGDLRIARAVAGQDFGFISGSFHGGDEIGRPQDAAQAFDAGLLGCKIDLRRMDTGNLA